MASPAEAEGGDNATAAIVEFPGCGEVPGDVCFLEKDPGTCKESFSVRWFYDVAYGGCSRDENSNPYLKTIFFSFFTVG